jgi:hypothetical protein
MSGLKKIVRPIQNETYGLFDSKNEEKSTYIDSEAIHTLNDVLDSNPKSPIVVRPPNCRSAVAIALTT